MAGRSEKIRTWSETLQGRLSEKLDGLLDKFLNSDDPAEKTQVEKEARTCGVFARSARAIATMVPEPNAKSAADEAANDDDEVSMHADIPDDPEELQAALVARFARIADLVERKRLADQADGGVDGGAGSGGSAAPPQRGPG